jgi:hypothetical protein
MPAEEDAEMSENEVAVAGEGRAPRGPRGPYKVSGKLAKALRYICEGKRLAEAARLAGMSDRGLTLALKRPSVAARLSDHARAVLASQLPLAASTINRVMSSDNMNAALAGARYNLAVAGGIALPERGPLLAINMETPCGYIIDLTGSPVTRPQSDDPAGPVIETEPQPDRGSAEASQPGGHRLVRRGNTYLHELRPAVEPGGD